MIVQVGHGAGSRSGFELRVREHQGSDSHLSLLNLFYVVSSLLLHTSHEFFISDRMFSSSRMSL